MPSLSQLRPSLMQTGHPGQLTMERNCVKADRPTGMSCDAGKVRSRTDASRHPPTLERICGFTLHVATCVGAI